MWKNLTVPSNWNLQTNVRSSNNENYKLEIFTILTSKSDTPNSNLIGIQWWINNEVSSAKNKSLEDIPLTTNFNLNRLIELASTDPHYPNNENLSWDLWNNNILDMKRFNRIIESMTSRWSTRFKSLLMYINPTIWTPYSLSRFSYDLLNNKPDIVDRIKKSWFEEWWIDFLEVMKNLENSKEFEWAWNHFTQLLTLLYLGEKLANS